MLLVIRSLIILDILMMFIIKVIGILPGIIVVDDSMMVIIVTVTAELATGAVRTLFMLLRSMSVFSMRLEHGPLRLFMLLRSMSVFSMRLEHGPLRIISKLMLLSLSVVLLFLIVMGVVFSCLVMSLVVHRMAEISVMLIKMGMLMMDRHFVVDRLVM